MINSLKPTRRQELRNVGRIDMAITSLRQNVEKSLSLQLRALNLSHISLMLAMKSER